MADYSMFIAPPPPFKIESYVTIGITVVTLLAMIRNVAPDLAMLCATVALLLCGIITEREAWSGFSNTGVLSVAVLFTFARCLQETGAVSLLFGALLGQPSGLFMALIRLLLPVTIVSAFMNNTPVR